MILRSFQTALAVAALAYVVSPAAAQQPAAPAQPAPTLLGQFGDWGAYTASPGGRKVCFALSKPTAAVTDPPGRSRDQPYIFVSTRPAEKVSNEVSITFGYPLKPGVDSSVDIGPGKFAMYTQNDGAWIKNAAEEAQLIEAMRKGADMVVHGISTRGTKTKDTYSLKGIAQALDRVAQECK